MAEDVIDLFREYAGRFRRGERPDVGDYLARAGREADDLAGLIDRFLLEAEPPEPSPEEVAMHRVWRRGEPPLLELRRRRRLKRAVVVDALVESLDLEPARREKVARYYHQLETGLLDARRVDRRVFAALAEALRARVEDHPLFWHAPHRPEDALVRAYLRAAEPAAAVPAPPPAPAEEEWDEVDELFRGKR